MANLRVVEVVVQDSTHIDATFTDNLDILINTSNVTITSNVAGVPDAEVLIVEIDGATLHLTTLPMTPYASYFINFISSDSVIFKSVNGFFLVQDGKNNTVLILGAEDPANPIRDTLIKQLEGQVYTLNPGGIIRDTVNLQSQNFARALYDIRQAKNDNYLSFTIVDELHNRGVGPYDRLKEEGAYEILRVATSLTGEGIEGSLSFDEFPSGPIALQATDFTETLIAGTADGTFNQLVLNLSNFPVTKVTSIVIKYSNHTSAIYDLATYGYRLQNPRYDPDVASTLLTLADNQVQLSEQAIIDGLRVPTAADDILITYQYKDLGRFIESDSVGVSQVLTSTREVTPPIVTVFPLAHSPIVTTNDIIANIGDVTWLDPSANPPFSTTHPAFINEVPFNFNALPTFPGEFAVDYLTGTVYVWGASNNDGTGDFPPTATYNYRQSFVTDLDYTYDSDFVELVASPLRELAGQEAKITFNFEKMLVEGRDYLSQIHQESLNERIDNRLNSTVSISPLNTPITNVFRIFNETSGELYQLQRFSDNKIYFNSVTPPRILISTRERAVFTDVLNEVLIINEVLSNNSSVIIWQFLLTNNRIINGTEDAIGTSFNTSAQLSRSDIFQTELYYDGQTETLENNIDRLSVGEYLTDYQNGIVYLAVNPSQSADVGTISYKKSVIAPANPHVTGVTEIYNSISTLTRIDKRINYLKFEDGAIFPSTFDISDERFTNGDETMPYFVNSDVVAVTDNIKDVRGVFDHFDLTNHSSPTNFGLVATSNANLITLNPVTKTEILIIQSGLILDLSFISPGVDVSSINSIIRLSDNVVLTGTISGYQINLSGTGSPTAGQEVQIIYSVTMNGAATPVVDYNRGDYFVDYLYLADEILISYEYGDNLLDFRQSQTLSQDDTYYVTYRVGARRDALLANFGTLVDLPILNTFDVSLPRENYRDALMGALQSFTKGPTLPSMKSLVKHITHIEPQIIEAAFQLWSLGISYLNRLPPDYSSDLQLMAGKYDNGVLIDREDQFISLPLSSNLKLQEGALETWVIPEWDGLDNDAILNFSQLTKDGYNLSPSEIWIGANSHHPSSIPFSISRFDESNLGLPSAVYTQVGMFVYYDPSVKRWQILARDNINNHKYTGNVVSSGEVYDVKFIPGLGEIDDVIRSANSNIYFEFNLDGYDVPPDGYDAYQDGYVPGYSFDGLTFMADDIHYLIDFGTSETTNRFSIFKDGRGYLNFEVWDKAWNNIKRSYKVSADISNWLAGQKHHVAVAWKIASLERRDELHLFIDGLEVPNILRYGGRPTSSASDRFRTVKPEILAGVIPKNTVGSNDLQITGGSNIVSSASEDFTAAGINIGDILTIREIGFSNYTITGVSGNTLFLSVPLAVTLENARFSVNEFSTVVISEIDLFNNFTVSILHNGVETEIPGLRASNPQYSIDKNLQNQNVLTILGSADAGDSVLIRTLGLNHRRVRDRKYIWGTTSNIIKTQLPPPISLDTVGIFVVELPYTIINSGNSAVVAGNLVFTTTTGSPSNTSQGRTLAIRITGGNVNFSMPVTVQITGNTSETLTFSSPGTKNTVNKYSSITSVVTTVKPIDITQNSAGIEIKEAFSIINSEGNATYPVIRYSYKTQTGSHLQGNGSATVVDSSGYFPISTIGQKLVIYTPAGVAGTYNIIGRTDDNTITVSPTPATSFSGGSYDIFNTTIGRSGFQNGFFTLETAGEANVPFYLPQGYVDFDFETYLEIAFDPIKDELLYIGSDLNQSHQARAILDELIILSTQLTDVRIGETVTTGERSITTDYTKLKAHVADSDILVLMHFDNFPLTNDADFWVNATKSYLQSDFSVNANFNKSLAIVSNPLIVDNAGLLDTHNEGSIEFWVSPKFDTYNDPNFRFYFDASASIIEETTSITNGTVKVANEVAQVLSVRLATDIQQTGTNYFAGGKILNDFKTLQLSSVLPFQQTPVIVNYIASGVNGDRLSIYKDDSGFITFNIHAAGEDYQVRQPVFWARDSWHRIRTTFKFNRSDHKDEIRLFVDGEERGMIKFGTGLLFGQGIVFGQGFAGVDNSILTADINFHDVINQFYIGSDYFGAHLAQARFDNLRISNISRLPFQQMGQPLDVNYSSNLDNVLPVIPDAFTTYLVDYDTLAFKTTNLALVRDELFGIFNFELDIPDTFEIVSANSKIKQILETLIETLKPAQSKVAINYF